MALKSGVANLVTALAEDAKNKREADRAYGKLYSAVKAAIERNPDVKELQKLDLTLEATTKKLRRAITGKRFGEVKVYFVQPEDWFD